MAHTAVLGRDGEAPPSFGRGDVDEPKYHDGGGQGTERDAGAELGQTGATPRPGRRFGVQHDPGVVVRPGMVWVAALGEDNELARIVSPIAERMKVERVPQRLQHRGRLDPRESIAVRCCRRCGAGSMR